MTNPVNYHAFYSNSGVHARTMEGWNNCDGVAVVPILGMCDVLSSSGVYNDHRVHAHLYLWMWVCLPESLDVDSGDGDDRVGDQESGSATSTSWF
jgi:hypothetical protein